MTIIRTQPSARTVRVASGPKGDTGATGQPRSFIDRLGNTLTQRDAVQELGYIADDPTNGRTVRDPGPIDARAAGFLPGATAAANSAALTALIAAQQAEASATGIAREIRLGAGTHAILHSTHQILVTHPCTIRGVRGADATVLAIDGGTGVDTYGIAVEICSHVRIADLTIQGPVTYGLLLNGSTDGSSTDFRIERVIFRACNQTGTATTGGITADHVNNVTVDECGFYDVGTPGIAARGVVTIHDTSGGSRSIPAGTVCTNTTTGATYTIDTTFTLGANATVTGVAVTSVDAGNSDASIGQINQIAITGATVTNPGAITGTNALGACISCNTASDHSSSGWRVRDCFIDPSCNALNKILLKGQSNCWIGRNEIHGGGAKNGGYTQSGYGIACYDTPSQVSTGVVIEDNWIYDTAGTGIYVQNQQWAKVLHNHLERNSLRFYNGTLVGGAIGSTGSTDPTDPSFGVEISANTILNPGNAQDCIVSSGQFDRIHDNTCVGTTNHGFGIQIKSAGTGTLVHHNTIVNCYYGIGTLGSILYADMMVDHNIIRLCPAGGMNFYILDRVHVTDNTLTSNGGFAILMSGGLKSRISGNNITGNASNGILLNGDIMIVSENIFDNCAAGITEASGNNNRIINNEFDACTADINAYAGSTAIMRGNKYSGVDNIAGRATLVAGSVTVTDARIKSTSTVTVERLGSSDGTIELSWVVSAGSLAITSSNGADTANVQWSVVT